MLPRFPMVLAALLLTGAHALAAPVIRDADTRAWWSIIGDLSGDDMEGRDTGSPAYARAVQYVEAKFKAAGLLPAGEGGGYTQTLPLHEVKVEKDGTAFAIVHSGGETPLVFLHQDLRPRHRSPAARAGRAVELSRLLLQGGDGRRYDG